MRNLIIIISIILFHSCKKETINPYDDPNLNPPNTDTLNYFTDPSKFSSLYNDIFLKHCSNSGCHDGSFEPDFRTIESSYNSLVYHPIIKNNNQNDYEYRVLPNNADQSVLYARLLSDLNGISLFDDNSQVMPLTADIAYDPDQVHEWHIDKEIHIENIKKWINNGALDAAGNNPILPNNKPEMQGVAAFISGTNTLLPRDGTRGTILIPNGTNSIDIWFSIIDDNLDPTELTYNKIKFCDNLFDFDQEQEINLIVNNTPILEVGYYVSQTVEYYHKITYDISSLNSGDERFFKIYVQDDVNEITEIPNNGSSYQIIRHFTFEII